MKTLVFRSEQVIRDFLDMEGTIAISGAATNANFAGEKEEIILDLDFDPSQSSLLVQPEPGTFDISTFAHNEGAQSNDVDHVILQLLFQALIDKYIISELKLNKMHFRIDPGEEFGPAYTWVHLIEYHHVKSVAISFCNISANFIIQHLLVGLHHLENIMMTNVGNEAPDVPSYSMCRLFEFCPKLTNMEIDNVMIKDSWTTKDMCFWIETQSHSLKSLTRGPGFSTQQLNQLAHASSAISLKDLYLSVAGTVSLVPLANWLSTNTSLKCLKIQSPDTATMNSFWNSTSPTYVGI